MTEASDIVSRIATELVRFARPLIVAGQDADVRRGLFDALGWDIANVTGFPAAQLTTDIQTLTQAALELVSSAATEPKSFEDIASRLENIKQIFDSVSDLSRLAQNANVPADAAAALAQLGEDLLQLLLVTYLQRHHPAILNVARILTLIQIAGDEPPETTAITSGGQTLRRKTPIPRVRFDRLGLLLSDPAQTLRDEYLGPNALDTEQHARNTAARIFDRFAALLADLGAVITNGSDSAGAANRDPARSLEFRFAFPVDGAFVGLGAIFNLVAETEGGAGITITPTGWVDASWDTGSWVIGLGLSGSVPGFTLRRSGPVMPAGTEALQIKLSVEKRTYEGTRAVVIGSPQATRLELGSVKLSGELAIAANRQDVDIEVSLGKGAVVIQAGDGDGFLQKVMPPEGFRFEFDLALGWSTAKGLHFRGSAGLEATLPLHIDLFEILQIESVYLALKAGGGNDQAPAINLIVATSIGLTMGPIAANVDRIGLRGVITFPAGGGNLGPLNFGLDFQPPRGVGFVIDANAVVGGGFLFFDPDASQYGGILQLEVKGGISIKAIGLITTKMPDGSPGFSLLIIIAVEFSPIQLGYGFTLNGVGGLAGFNRTMKVDPLRDGIKNRTLDSIMFPPDPIKNAQRIISDLTAIFPPAPDRFVFAPMVKFGWGAGILLIEVGLVVELPSPLRLAIMGKLHVKLPPIESGDGEESKNLVELHLDVLGILDFDRGEISVDAVLYNSRLVIFPITGGMAMRLRWGNDPIFLMAIGGLNPRFPVPPAFPIVDRLGINLSYDQSGFKACLRLETYLAVTPNSLQFGARIDAYAEFAVAKIAGFLGFDALIEFTPFHFIVDLYAGVVVQAFGFSFGVDLLLVFSGPGPFLGEGHATVQFLGKHEFPVRFVIGEEREETPLPPVDPLPELVAALEDVRNWSAAVPAGDSMLLTMRQLAPDEQGTKLLAHPLGDLTVRQKVLPFGIALDLFGAAPPMSPGPYDVASVRVGAPAGVAPTADRTLRDTFARGQFVAMSEDEKATSPGFESFRCGLTRLGTEAVVYPSAAAQEAVFEYDVTVIDDKENPSSGRAAGTAVLTGEHFLQAAQFGAARQSPMTGTGSTKFAGQAKGIRVRKPQHRVADRDGLTPSGGAFASYTEAQAASQGTPGDWQIVDAYEVA
ncbi:MAG TPA: hypothetical protein DEU95_13110 [Chloroflexi bacterium]|jgi:hypothetical protein|nr:hypothetical protein [Steroidobacteraceae bacterium]HCG30624.1 hypothetical protein [Chloroflexota bacterium]